MRGTERCLEGGLDGNWTGQLRAMGEPVSSHTPPKGEVRNREQKKMWENVSCSRQLDFERSIKPG